MSSWNDRAIAFGRYLPAPSPPSGLGATFALTEGTAFGAIPSAVDGVAEDWHVRRRSLCAPPLRTASCRSAQAMALPFAAVDDRGRRRWPRCGLGGTTLQVRFSTLMIYDREGQLIASSLDGKVSRQEIARQADGSFAIGLCHGRGRATGCRRRADTSWSCGFTIRRSGCTRLRASPHAFKFGALPMIRWLLLLVGDCCLANRILPRCSFCRGPWRRRLCAPAPGDVSRWRRSRNRRRKTHPYPLMTRRSPPLCRYDLSKGPIKFTPGEHRLYVGVVLRAADCLLRHRPPGGALSN